MSAQNGSDCARARLQGMKIRAELDPPRAAVGGFPYPARTCAEWQQSEADGRTRPRHARPTENHIEREMTTSERKKDAVEGSARLKEAIQSLNSRCAAQSKIAA